jgi:D-sedoheptulose 7-phosphate isomerase
MVELSLIVPARHTPFIQEAHVTIIHLLCDLVEQQLFGE